MTGVFISHSSHDNACATDLTAILRTQGYVAVFLDFDPADGIPAGRDWEQELYSQLQAAQVMLVLSSRETLASQWCFAEITHAKALGKPIIPIRIDDGAVHPLLRSIQHIDWNTDRASGCVRLLDGMKRAGFDQRDSFPWDRSRSPYPGLFAYQEADAAIYFGREHEIQQGLEQLNRQRSFGGARTLLVLGASGSGKSSLVRAGIVPRLRRDTERWLVLPTVRPGHQPLRELAGAFAESLCAYGNPTTQEMVHGYFKARWGDMAAGGATLLRGIETLRKASRQSEPTVVLVVDQAEELLTYQNDPEDVQMFIGSLAVALASAGRSLSCIFTLRSDYLNAFQCHPLARAIALEPLALGPLMRERLVSVIERPAQLAGVRLERGLTEALLEDTVGDRALPLLAFTLRELYEKYGADRLLQIDEYRRQLGGLAGSVAQVAERVYSACQLSAEQAFALRNAFCSLVRVDEEGRYVKQSARLGTFSRELDFHLEHFVRARLLVASNNDTGRVFEVAHDSLFYVWARLKQWLDEERAYLVWRQRITVAIGNWQRLNRDKGALLRGQLLAEALYYRHQRIASFTKDEREYIDASFFEQNRDRALTLKTRNAAKWANFSSIILAVVSWANLFPKKPWSFVTMLIASAIWGGGLSLYVSYIIRRRKGLYGGDHQHLTVKPLCDQSDGTHLIPQARQSARCD